MKKKLLNASNHSAAVLKGLIDKNILEIENIEDSRIKDVSEPSKKMPILSKFQENACNEVNQYFKKGSSLLLHGVTGSGKTEIYIKLIDQQLKNNKKVLYLLPEIAITTQIIQRLQSFFGNRVGVYHSRFNLGERTRVELEITTRECSLKKRFVPFYSIKSTYNTIYNFHIITHFITNWITKSKYFFP